MSGRRVSTRAARWAAVIALCVLAGCARRAPVAPGALAYPEYVLPADRADSAAVSAQLQQAWTLLQANDLRGAGREVRAAVTRAPSSPAASALQGYVSLKAMGRIPIAGGEHGFTQYEFRDMLEARAVDYIQFDTNRVGGITQARKISAMAESFGVPVVPHAGQMHNSHIVIASLNSPMAEFFPQVDVEVGNELFWYCFNGEPIPTDGCIDLDESTPGLGLTVNEDSLKNFEVIE